MGHNVEYKAAIAHVSPVFLNTAATVSKACSIIEEAARNGAQLVVFPEAYIPAFPLWSALQAPIYNHDFFVRLAHEAIRVPGPELERISRVARTAGVFVSIGFNEGTAASVGCIWNSNVLIGDDGTILNHHRKLVPTFYEKLTWANGDGAGLRVNETRLGRVGMLICGENTNPLARFTLMAQGEQVHIATYPPLWPTRDPGQGGNYDLADAIRIRAAAHSFEAKCYTLVAAGYLDSATRQALLVCGSEAGRIMDESPRGVSMAISPTGKQIGDKLADSEGILYVDINLEACIEPKQFHDVVGGYNRFDIFHLTVTRARNRPICFTDKLPLDADAISAPVVAAPVYRAEDGELEESRINTLNKPRPSIA